MKFTQVGTVVALVALLTMAFAYSAAQGSATHDSAALVAGEAPGTRSPQAAEAEAALTRTNLASRLEGALGSAFGGVWFEPATAQVHVGVTSAASRRDAEALAAQAGLAAAVTETSVGSTWAQLQAAQDSWDGRLEDLLAHGEAATALAPDRNSVEVELGSSVPASRRTALEREAANDNVSVSIEIAPYPHLRVEAQARCNKFVKEEAFCDPTIVGGVSIDGEVVGGKRKTCTSGPAVILAKPANEAEATKTYILTAGHCIDKDGGNGKKWYAYNKAGEEKEIGTSITFLNAETDVGVIEVTTKYWAKAEDPPVVPVIASWNKVAESTVFPVIEKRTPMKGTKSCISAQMTATACGEIITTDQTIEVEGVVTKNLIEVKGVATEQGDSGAPWFAEKEFKEATPKGYVEGTHVGTKGETGNPVFQSLDTSFAELEKIKGISLKLLTEANQKRH
jgi:hypothetical protein